MRVAPWLAGIAALALLAILGLYLPGWRALFLACKPLATAAILVLALRLPCAQPRYRHAVVAGLALGLLGDVLLILPGERAFMAGLGSFLLGHVAYLQAWRQRARLLAAAWPFVLYGVLACAVFAFLWTHLPAALRVPVAVYVIALAMMAAQAAATWSRNLNRPSAFAAVGGACFLASDAILAVDRFALPFLAAQALLLALYWLAQSSIALSVRDRA